MKIKAIKKNRTYILDVLTGFDGEIVYENRKIHKAEYIEDEELVEQAQTVVRRLVDDNYIMDVIKEQAEDKGHSADQLRLYKLEGMKRRKKDEALIKELTNKRRKQADAFDDLVNNGFLRTLYNMLDDHLLMCRFDVAGIKCFLDEIIEEVDKE